MANTSPRSAGPLGYAPVLMHAPADSFAQRRQLLGLHVADETTSLRHATISLGLQQQIFKPPTTPPIPKFTGNAGAGPDMGSDVRWMFAAVTDGILNDPHIGILPGNVGTFAATGLGVTTILSGVNGSISLWRARQGLEAARRMGYRAGVAEGHMNSLVFGTQAVAGLSYAVVRPLTWVSLKNGVNFSSASAATQLGKATFWANTVGSILWGIFFLFLGILAAIGIYKHQKFLNEMEPCLALRKELADEGARNRFFASLRNPQSEEGKKNFNKLIAYVRYLERWSEAFPLHTMLRKDFDGESSSDLSNDALMELAKERGGELVRKQLGEAGDRLYDDQCENLFEQAIEQIDPAHSDHLMTLIGARLKADQLRAKRAMVVGDLTDQVCWNGWTDQKGLDAIGKEIMQLARTIDGNRGVRESQMLSDHLEAMLAGRCSVSGLRPLKAIFETSQPVVDKMAKTAEQKRKENIILFIACVLGLVLTILSFVFTAGIGPLVISCVWILYGIFMGTFDTMNWTRNLDSGRLGKGDKWNLAIQTLIAIGVTLAVLIFIALHFSPVSLMVYIGLLIGIGGTGVTWAGFNTYTFFKILAREKELETKRQVAESPAIAADGAPLGISQAAQERRKARDENTTALQDELSHRFALGRTQDQGHELAEGLSILSQAIDDIARDRTKGFLTAEEAARVPRPEPMAVVVPAPSLHAVAQRRRDRRRSPPPLKVPAPPSPTAAGGGDRKYGPAPDSPPVGQIRLSSAAADTGDVNLGLD